MAKGIKTLVVSNGDGESVLETLRTMGLNPVSSGTGSEGVAAIDHYHPGLIMVFVRPKEAEDIQVLRAVQGALALHLEEYRPKGAVFITGAEQAPVVKRLLHSPNGQHHKEGRCKVVVGIDSYAFRKAISDFA